MNLDPTTETIAHFSGLFELAVEEARLRKDYQEFKALQEKEAEEAQFDFTPVRIKSPYDLGDYDPGVRYIPTVGTPQPGSQQALPQIDPLEAMAPASGNALPPLMPREPLGDDAGGSIRLPYVPTPSSVVTITLQSILLQDDDTYGDPGEAGFMPVEIFHAQLAQAIELAGKLAPWTADTLVQDVLSDPAEALAFRDEIEAVTAPAHSAADVFITTDEAAYSIFVDGEEVEELPDADALLPAYIANKRESLAEQKDAEEPGGDLAGHSKGETGKADALEGLAATFANSGHNVTAGANEAHNIVDLHTSWIDAGVFAVAGDVISLNAISQINILADHNYVDGQIQNSATPSQAINVASLAEQTFAEANELELPVDPEVPEGLPEVWNVVYYKGDVTVTNLVKQQTFATDNDQLQLEFTAQSTTLVTGENQMLNFAGADAFGSGYDLILVGGSMISLNVINQTNVLLDDDYFSGPGLGHASISAADNLLHNHAMIRKEGIDEQIEMRKEFQDALKDMTKEEAKLAKDAAKSELFAGKQALKALKIDGNLTQINVIEQSNYLGDQDQVHMAADAMLSVLDDTPVSITTGSNLLKNSAEVVSAGLDSQVMTDGDYYSDALLYQADLIDTDASPHGVSVAALASEAVAFLADDMINTTISEKLEAAGFDQDAHTGGTSFDVMQTMTA